MNVVFLGASRFGLRCLQKVLKVPLVKVTGILTAPSKFTISYSPERPVGNVLHADFHALAWKEEIPILEMSTKMTDPVVVDFIQQCASEFILVVGWYHMVPKIIRKLPPKGVAGIHASLLPKYSGGAPLVWAMINGEEKTGLTLFYFDGGVDSGDIIGQRRVAIRLNDTIAMLYERVEEEGLSLLEEMLPRIVAGTAPRIAQKEEGRTVFPQRKPEDGKIDWFCPSLSVYNFIRAQTKPYPGAFTFRKGKKLTIWEAKLYDFIELMGKPGEVLDIIDSRMTRGFLIATKHNDIPLLVTKVGTGEINYIEAIDYTRREDFRRGGDTGLDINPKLLGELRRPYQILREEIKRKWNRDLALEELLFDRWERARQL